MVVRFDGIWTLCLDTRTFTSLWLCTGLATMGEERMGRNAYSGFKVKHACEHIAFYERLLPQEQEDGFTDQEARLKAREAKLT